MLQRDFEFAGARITFATPEGNRCLVFEGAEPTTAEYPNIQLRSGYDFMGNWAVICTIADSLFAKATVCKVFLFF